MKCVSIVSAHATSQRGYAVLRSELSSWRLLKQLIRILCAYPGSTVQPKFFILTAPRLHNYLVHFQHTEKTVSED